MRLPADTISSMPTTASSISTQISAVSSLARASVSNDMMSTSAAPPRMSSLVKRLKASLMKAPLNSTSRSPLPWITRAPPAMSTATVSQPAT